MARPNILMFGDGGWDSLATRDQRVRLERWLLGLGRRTLAIVELGAGRAIPTVRHFCETAARIYEATLIRINPREPDVPKGQVGLAMGARDALLAIEERLAGSVGERLDQG
jgi:hypothetical protein